MNSEPCPKLQEQPTPALDAPECFDRALLRQPPGERQAYFEQECLVEHPRLLEALDAVLQAICAPGDGAQVRRPGTMVLVIGPTRVGKTTLIRLLEARLLAYAAPRMRHDAHFIPLASITAPEPGSGRFDWMEYYMPLLRQLGNPFADSPTAPIRARWLREALEAALLARKPLALIVDEAHHLGKTRSGRHLQDHLDHLKHFENRTGVSHILVGTYEMRPFRSVSAQLACRSVDVHFPRYDMLKEEDCRVFRSVLWALQRQLPVDEEPPLAEKHWEFLYARSIGCIGLLKLHLNRALNLALHQRAPTVTAAHLRQTAASDVRIKLVLRNALESEAEFVEAGDADEQLLALLRRPTARGLAPAAGNPSGEDAPQSSPAARNPQPGKRAPGRDATGMHDDGAALPEQADTSRVAG